MIILLIHIFIFIFHIFCSPTAVPSIDTRVAVKEPGEPLLRQVKPQRRHGVPRVIKPASVTGSCDQCAALTGQRGEAALSVRSRLWYIVAGGQVACGVGDCLVVTEEK